MPTEVLNLATLRAGLPNFRKSFYCFNLSSASLRKPSTRRSSIRAGAPSLAVAAGVPRAGRRGPCPPAAAGRWSVQRRRCVLSAAEVVLGALQSAECSLVILVSMSMPSRKVLLVIFLEVSSDDDNFDS